MKIHIKMCLFSLLFNRSYWSYKRIILITTTVRLWLQTGTVPINHFNNEKKHSNKIKYTHVYLSLPNCMYLNNHARNVKVAIRSRPCQVHENIRPRVTRIKAFKVFMVISNWFFQTPISDEQQILKWSYSCQLGVMKIETEDFLLFVFQSVSRTNTVNTNTPPLDYLQTFMKSVILIDFDIKCPG